MAPDVILSMVGAGVVSGPQPRGIKCSSSKGRCMIDHKCPKCANVFQAEKSPTGVPRKCPECGARKAHPVRLKGMQKSLPMGITGCLLFVFCIAMCEISPYVSILTGLGLVGRLVMYTIALPMCIYGMFSSKEAVFSRILGAIGVLLICLLLVVEIRFWTSKKGRNRTRTVSSLVEVQKDSELLRLS